MIPKEKAFELVDEAMRTLIFQIKQNIEADTITASKCLAINTVSEIVKNNSELLDGLKYHEELNYWEEVKEEIIKL